MIQTRGCLQNIFFFSSHLLPFFGLGVKSLKLDIWGIYLFSANNVGVFFNSYGIPTPPSL